MKPFFRPSSVTVVLVLFIISGVFFSAIQSMAQSCPSNGTTNLAANPDTYFPATASAAAGTKTITLGAASSGTAIASGDFLLIIQMQGAKITYTNGIAYGDGSTGSGYTSGSQVAGTMEFATAASAVPLTGGTLTLANNLTNGYTYSTFTSGASDGNYRYQVIRIPLYFDITLTANIAAPGWNGSTGGVVVVDGTNSVNMGGFSISATDSGFRGGAGRKLAGASGTLNTDYVTLATVATDASKGEGIAGTPRYLNFHGFTTAFDNTLEGYPNGSYSRGAPGNAGGGATDGTPTNNAENAGGGGGGNGGIGGFGGEGWHATYWSGGYPGAAFAQRSPSNLVMGGGGGAGDTNDGTGTPAGGIASSGVSGGGIVILLTTTISGIGTINVSGGSSTYVAVNDGSGGGGGGGSALIYASSGHSNITVNAAGGTGGSNLGQGGSHGPGGGGGGGVVYSNGTLNAATSVAGGSNGLTNGVSYLSTAGSAGVLVQNITQSNLPPNSVSCLTLPVTFVSVSAALDNASVQVEWSVASELNVSDYIVERSIDGVNFSKEGTLPRASSTYIGIDHYTFDDISKITTSVVYYRIIEVDNDGHETKSNVVSVNTGNVASAAMTIAPNPVQNSAIVAFTSKTTNPVQVRIINMGGNTVWSQQYGAGVGRRLLTVDNVAALSTGVYILLCSDGANQEETKLVISH